MKYQLLVFISFAFPELVPFYNVHRTFVCKNNILSKMTIDWGSMTTNKADVKLPTFIKSCAIRPINLLSK